jgi:acyl-CoA hydrolase
MIERRFPHLVGKAISKGINAGEIDFADKHLSMFAQVRFLRDLAVIPQPTCHSSDENSADAIPLHRT